MTGTRSRRSVKSHHQFVSNHRTTVWLVLYKHLEASIFSFQMGKNIVVHELLFRVDSGQPLGNGTLFFTGVLTCQVSPFLLSARCPLLCFHSSSCAEAQEAAQPARERCRKSSGSRAGSGTK